MDPFDNNVATTPRCDFDGDGFDAFCGGLRRSGGATGTLCANVYRKFYARLSTCPKSARTLFRSVAAVAATSSASSSSSSSSSTRPSFSTSATAVRQDVVIDHAVLNRSGGGKEFRELFVTKNGAENRPYERITSKWAAPEDLEALLKVVKAEELVIVTQQKDIDQWSAWTHLSSPSSSVQKLTIRFASCHRRPAGKSDSDVGVPGQAPTPLAKALKACNDDGNKKCASIELCGGVTDSAVSQVCSSPGSLPKRLSLACYSKEQAHALATAVSDVACPLTDLEVTFQDPSCGAEEELAAGLSKNSSIQSLCLKRGRFSAGLSGAIAGHARLESLRLSQCTFVEDAALPLPKQLQALELLDTITKVLSTEGTLLDQIDRCISVNLRRLSLSGDVLHMPTVEQAQGLARLLGGDELCEISLGRMQFDKSVDANPSLRIITTALVESMCLERVCLTEYGQGIANGEQYIAALLRGWSRASGSKTLRCLSMRDCSLDRVGTLALEQLVQNSSLNELSVHLRGGNDNGRGEALIASLSRSLADPKAKLQTLQLLPSGPDALVSFTSGVMSPLYQSLVTNTGLRVLQVGGRNHGSETKSGWKAFCDALPHMNHLQTLLLSDLMELNGASEQELLDALEKNVSLRFIDGVSCLQRQDAMEYWLRLNRADRSLLRSDEPTKCILPSLLSKCSDDADVLFYFLKETNLLKSR